MGNSTETISLGGGCFWCVEAVYQEVLGVTGVESGYCNGQTRNPSYEAVCAGSTGHAEVVRVSFDPTRISLRQVLEIFFVVHDPTTLNRQGNDTGTQYRSGIYFHQPGQEATARDVLADANEFHKGRVVTEIAPEHNYWRADDEHQHYFARHPQQGYCLFVVAPKVEKFRKTFKSLLRAA